MSSMKNCLGYDCDGNEIEEFRILRAVWANDVDINELEFSDPRQYCAVVAANGKAYAISVYDWWYEALIRERENIPNGEIPIIVKPIEKMRHYEVAVDGNGDEFYYSMEGSVSRIELKKTLNRFLKENRPKEMIVKEQAANLIAFAKASQYRGNTERACECYKAAILLGDTDEIIIYAYALKLDSENVLNSANNIKFDTPEDIESRLRKFEEAKELRRRSIAYFELGREQGSLDCIMELAYSYYEGVVVGGEVIVERNLEIALNLFEIARDMGSDSAGYMANKIANAKVDNGTAYCKVIPAISSQKEEA